MFDRLYRLWATRTTVVLVVTLTILTALFYLALRIVHIAALISV